MFYVCYCVSSRLLADMFWSVLCTFCIGFSVLCSENVKLIECTVQWRYELNKSAALLLLRENMLVIKHLLFLK